MLGVQKHNRRRALASYPCSERACRTTCRIVGCNSMQIHLRSSNQDGVVKIDADVCKGPRSSRLLKTHFTL